MLRDIHLHGRLSEEFGPVFRLDVETAGEAVRALACNFPNFMTSIKEGYFEIVRGALDDGMDIDLESLNEFRLGNADLHIIPHIAGSKNPASNPRAGGSLKLILGVALIGTAMFVSGGALGTPLMSSGLLSGLTYGNVAMVGVALAVAGVSTLLSQRIQDPNNQSSFTLTGPGNSYAQGNPVPLVYGEVLVGSQLISGSLDIEPIPVNWDPTNGNTSIMTYDAETGQGVVSGGPATYTQPSGYT